jgi:ADP-ribose pyrophosphatase YjhB (NUDIX family)
VDFYNLPGGRAKFQETTMEAITREMKEELGLDIENPKLIAVAENFFTWANQNVEELLFIYKIDLDDSYYDILDHFKNIDSECEYMYWAKLDESLLDLDIRPTLIYSLPMLDHDKINHLICK